MSASTEKKLRQAAREAGTDKKMLAAQEEARKKARSKLRWTIGTIAVILLIAFILFLNSGLLYKTTAYTVGDKDYSAAEVSYYYANQYNYWANQYGNYAYLFGLDTSNGIRGLGKQDCPMSDGTWKDYFLSAAENEMLQVKALNDYAKANGIELDGEEIAAIDSSLADIDSYAKIQGYASADKMLAANYGQGVTVSMVRQAYLDSSLASKVTEQVNDSFSYTDAQLEEKYASYEGSNDMFDFAYYLVEAEKTTTKDADGNDTETVTPEALDVAMIKAEAIEEAYKKAEGDSSLDRLNAAIAGLVPGDTATEQSNVTGSSISIAPDWLRDSSREAGDVTFEENSAGTGYHVVVFLNRDDNHYRTVSVRHILIKAEPSEDGSYTDEAKAAAKARAEEILAEFEAGDRTEDSFAALANEYSEDAGSNTNGGLYENIHKGQMVKEFNDFCFDDHKAGDTAIVYGESGSYAGYHVMYYVGQGELYSNYLAGQDLRAADLTAWMDELTSGYEAVVKSGIRYVGK